MGKPKGWVSGRGRVKARAGEFPGNDESNALQFCSLKTKGAPMLLGAPPVLGS
jgi:hypothetical protein